MTAEKRLARQDTDYAINPGTNNETSIKITNEILGIFYKKLPQETTKKDITFNIYKEDFIKSACGIISSLPLLDKHGKQVAFTYDLCNQLLSRVNTYFGEETVKPYKAELLYNTDRNSCLQGFDSQFNIRNYTVEAWSTISFSKKGDVVSMRLIFSKSKGFIQKQKSNDELSWQQIFYGAPGTGKSHKIKDNEDVKKADEKNLVFRTTFHPDSDYSTFVGCYKPTMKPVADKYKAVAGKDEEISYSFIPQAFLQAYVAAWNNPDDNVYLVIEEINRGNCAQIFGDLFQLLDRDDNGYSEYSIMADNDLAKYLNGKDENDRPILSSKDGIKDGKLCLPKNLYIWATMNTSDQSLFPIDSAFKRRWDWVYMPIGYKNTNWIIEIGNKEYNWDKFQRIINEKIYEVDSSEDKKLGDYFVNADRTGGKISADTLLNKIVFYLWNDVCKDEPDQIFRWIDDKKEEKSIKFSEFFEGDREKKLQGFMAFHKVPAIGESSEEEKSEGIDETGETEREEGSGEETTK